MEPLALAERYFRGGPRLDVHLNDTDFATLTPILISRRLNNEPSVVTTIAFYGDFFEGYGERSFLDYMQAIGQFNSIKRLEFHYLMVDEDDEDGDWTKCPMAWLTGLLRSLRHNLENLQFASVVLFGSEQDVHDFGDAVRELGCLRNLAFTGSLVSRIHFLWIHTHLMI